MKEIQRSLSVTRGNTRNEKKKSRDINTTEIVFTSIANAIKFQQPLVPPFFVISSLFRDALSHRSV